MAKTSEQEATYSQRLSREINAAYEAYKAAASPEAEKRLMEAPVAQARNIARFRLGEMVASRYRLTKGHMKRKTKKPASGSDVK